jgi:ketosteroid isomerase-like protein
MAEHPNAARVRDAYAAYATGDLETALADLAKDCVFHLRGTGPLSGDAEGVDEIAKRLIGSFELTGGTQKFDIKGFYADEEHAVVVLRETATRTDGKTLDIDEVHVLKFDAAGKITDLWDLPSDPQVHDDFFDGR